MNDPGTVHAVVPSARLTEYRSGLPIRNPRVPERAETRLFDLRAIARKHRCEVDELPEKMREFRSQLDAIEGGEAEEPRVPEDPHDEPAHVQVDEVDIARDGRDGICGPVMEGFLPVELALDFPE